MKQKVIKKHIFKKLRVISWNELSEQDLNIHYLKLRKLFSELLGKETIIVRKEVKQNQVPDGTWQRKVLDSTFQSVEQKEKVILAQAILILKRVYYDPDVATVFEKDMDSAGSPQVEDSLKDITKTSDFLEFIGKLLRK